MLVIFNCQAISTYHAIDRHNRNRFLFIQRLTILLPLERKIPVVHLMQTAIGVRNGTRELYQMGEESVASSCNGELCDRSSVCLFMQAVEVSWPMHLMLANFENANCIRNDSIQ